MKPLTLVLVDDHVNFRTRARDLLEGFGFVVIGEAGNGTEALRTVRTLRPDVVLLDIVLPELDGFAVCEQLAAERCESTIVLTSTRSASVYRRRLTTCSARGFIPKHELTGASLASMIERR